MAQVKMTKASILRKVNRKRNPVTSIAQLAREFGVDPNYNRYSIGEGPIGVAAPHTFRREVRSLVGKRTYDKIRDTKSVNLAYR